MQENLAKSLSSSSSKKRVRADSETPSPASAGARSVKRGRNNAATESAYEVADAIRTLAKVMDTGPTTPQRRKQAIGLLYTDAQFSPGERGLVLRLFKEDIGHADMYLDIPDVEGRSDYLRSILSEVEL
jgi:hypothetical protein